MSTGKAVILGIWVLLIVLALPFIVLIWVLGILVEAFRVVFS